MDYEIYHTVNVKNLLGFTVTNFFDIKIVGVGKPDIECTSSYLSRLCDLHKIIPSILIKHQFLPCLHSIENLKLSSDINYIQFTASWWKGLATVINGLTSSTELWISCLEKVTQSSDLRYATLLTYKNVLSMRGLMRPTRAWCPFCYEEQRLKQQIVYDKLIWMLAPVILCSDHKLKLQTHCPYLDCRRPLLPIHSKSQIGFCYYCDRWLGTNVIYPSMIPTSEELADQLYISGVVGDLLANTNTFSEAPQLSNFATTVSQFVNQVCDGNVSKLAKQLGMHRTSIHELCQGTQLPQLGTLIKLSRILELSPLEILKATAQRNFSIVGNGRKIAVDGKLTKRYRKLDKIKIQQYLESVIAEDEYAGFSLAYVARKLGYDPSFLHKHFPDLCTQISRRYANFLSSQKLQRQESMLNLMRQTILQLHSQKIYPHYRVVSKILGGMCKDKFLRDEYLNIMRELGYRN